MISVIVPVYNAQSTVQRCIDSILSQTYRDIELLLIDDGSDDDTPRILNEYKKDPRVRLFHTENGGVSCARNCGLDYATGDFITFVDADDWIEPTAYEVALNSLRGHDVCIFGRIVDWPKKKTDMETGRQRRNP